MKTRIMDKYYEILTKPVALFKNNVCIYQNSKYEKLSLEKKFWITSKVKEGKENKGIQFFRYDIDTIGCIVEENPPKKRNKTKFLSRMSHDLRTPLYSILGTTSLALSNLEEKENVISSLETISESSKHLLELINEMLDMGRIENGKLSLNEEGIELSEFLEEIVEIVTPFAKEYNIRLETTFINIKHPNILVDKKRLKQLLVNLLANAIKYNNSGGWVEFKVIGEDTIDSSITKYMFVVEDNGIGMRQEFLNKLFQPYTRADENQDATEIGLTISKAIVDLFGGEIQVQSQYKIGTKFTVFFQFKTNPDAKEKKYEELLPIATALFEGKNVLLVEDNFINMTIASEVIKSVKANVVVAENGIAAVEFFSKSEENYFDLVFMDVQMPKLNGYEATKRIRALPRKDVEKLPIVGMSANAFAEDIIKGKESGMSDYLSKPVEVNDIIKIMIKHLKNRSLSLN